ncbi:putative glycosidase [Rosa chinensis]|uniref:Putative glycosidase n=1 Tax=Rosa chinensis TaxID=74649 RepID=A0A2P6RGV2_ROSCH|nr:putative glycosidase [Rosa chinensis]
MKILFVQLWIGGLLRNVTMELVAGARLLFLIWAKIIFGLNALPRLTLQSDGSATGSWNFTNAESFIRYTLFECCSGNELCGRGIGTTVAASQYVNDTASLHKIVQNVYKGVGPKPLILSLGGFFDAPWFKELADKSTSSLDAVTHHIFNLGPGRYC